MFIAKVILDSMAPCGKRLTTMELRFPRFILAEVNTHRDRARNAASSRAVPWPKMLAAVTEQPVIPIHWGSEKKGMQTGGEVNDPEEAVGIWLRARDNAVRSAQALADLGVHKALCNRLVEPFMWVTVVMSATEWANFFRQRCHPDAEDHFQKIACMARDALGGSKPFFATYGYWHRPYIDSTAVAFAGDDEDTADVLNRISAARCARVSYLTHYGKSNPAADLALFDRLKGGSGMGHWSPTEHVAQALPTADRSGPFIGWKQFRKEFAQENLPG